MRRGGVHTFPKGISPKVNVIAHLEFEHIMLQSSTLTTKPSKLPTSKLEIQKKNAIISVNDHQVVHKPYYMYYWKIGVFIRWTKLLLPVLVLKAADLFLYHCYNNNNKISCQIKLFAVRQYQWLLLSSWYLVMKGVYVCVCGGG